MDANRNAHLGGKILLGMAASAFSLALSILPGSAVDIASFGGNAAGNSARPADPATS